MPVVIQIKFIEQKAQSFVSITDGAQSQEPLHPKSSEHLFNDRNSEKKEINQLTPGNNL